MKCIFSNVLGSVQQSLVSCIRYRPFRWRPIFT